MNTNERKPNWFNQDALWEGAGDYMFGSEVLERAPQEDEQVLSLAQLTPPIRVLDMPCGVGWHSLELAWLGCDVTSVDRKVQRLVAVAHKPEST